MKNHQKSSILESKTLDRSGLEVDFWDREVILKNRRFSDFSFFWDHGLKNWWKSIGFSRDFGIWDWLTAGVLDKMIKKSSLKHTFSDYLVTLTWCLVLWLV